jgi:uncharacterized repeat protein (TIGR03803 family)
LTKQAKPAVTQTYTQTVVHQFGSGEQDGTNPMSGLIKDSAGNFYGITSQGGQNDIGAIFEFVPSRSGGTYNSIYSSFGGVFLTMDSLGNLYPASGGAASGVEELSKGLDGNWIQSKGYGFTGYYDGTGPSAPVVVDSAGNVYGTALGGGAYNSGTIYELTTVDNQWLENTLFAMGSGHNTTSSPNSLIMDSSGDFYGTAEYGGAANYGALFKLHHTANGWVYRVVYTFQGGPNDGGYPMGNLTFDAAGNIYGTATAGFQSGISYCCGGVYKITKSGKITWLYLFQGGPDGGAPASGVVFDKSGNLYGSARAGGGGNPDYCVYGALYGCGVVFKLTPPSPGSLDTSWTESVLHTFTGGTDGDEAIEEPTGPLVFDDAGNLYGITYGGGNGWAIGGQGVLYELTPDPVATTIAVTTTSPNPAAVGQPVTIKFSVVGLNPTGIVTVQSSTGEACVAPIRANGTGGCALRFGAAGPKTLTASYAGDTENLASTSSGVTLQVQNLTKTTIAKNAPDPAKVGQPVTVHFDVTTNDSAPKKTLPTGSVTVNASTGESCTGTLAPNGGGKCEIAFSSSGSRTLIANYAGDADNDGSVSTAAAETVK